ncbi:hypothetical protein [Helicobacter ailurogastricus]|uniref:hypothetical protein n=1 Tax=Helicobacter ailurogastricus TaxID=1578720 RepID=UPI0025537B1D|nr:hypothetical protein [Helicobacter ailurogastricus]
MEASWCEFVENENLSNPKHSFTKHISTCFELFKEYIEKEEVWALNETSFYLPKEKVFGFVYQQTKEKVVENFCFLAAFRQHYKVNVDRTFTPSLLHQMFIESARESYHKVKFAQQQVENVMARLYPKLPVLRNQNQQAIHNGLQINQNCSCLDKSCDKILLSPYSYVFLNHNNQLEYLLDNSELTYIDIGSSTLNDKFYHYAEHSTLWTLDLVPATQSLEENFAFFTLCLQPMVTNALAEAQALRSLSNFTEEQRAAVLAHISQRVANLPANDKRKDRTLKALNDP